MTVNLKDEKRKHILELLLEDGTRSYSTIAQILGMHHSTVKKYIAELEESGIILGYSADVAFERIAEMYIVLFRCDPFTKEDYELLRERLEKKAAETEELKVLDYFFTVGEFQTSVVLMTTNVFSLHRYLNFLISSYNYLRSYVVLQVSRTNQRNLHPNMDWQGLEKLADFEGC
ncbi:MAG: Lrp/AsnC family transcriptional regulator [Theionarchaea archaeon]|nr:Lrp/AsnC family transcriptional regulator [Theionarchaea archaeon]MBU7001496.1 Lrp/AsnC family transcriptional regulator [Theionarchaea archaeon]MBU7021526.1 Lrp/AsnC family transcriptional regulator [Theionarchaea archaeon]MBU7036268.1 Lrp/AsnC family transcriptional regulator [Theionarchaea archaeon]MBU7041428.1 Lrp/AsnC family transcriptional regulator [Theionarchaea archaeon]